MDIYTLGLQDQLKQMESENLRLRKALEEIAEEPCYEDTKVNGFTDCGEANIAPKYWCGPCKARKALKGEE